MSSYYTREVLKWMNITEYSEPLYIQIADPVVMYEAWSITYECIVTWLNAA